MKNLYNYELFLESVRKYEIITFNKDYVLKGIYGGEEETFNINVKKGEKMKVFFENNSSDDCYIIKAIRPMYASQNEKKKNIETLSLSELWEGNFLLSKPIKFDKKSLPFDIENYL